MGLLNRFSGPTLVKSGGEGPILVNPSTSDLLGSIRPDLDRGVLHVPALTDAKDEFAIVPLHPGQKCDNVEKTIQSLFQEAAFLRKDYKRWGFHSDIPIPSTQGNWSLEEQHLKGWEERFYSPLGNGVAIYYSEDTRHVQWCSNFFGTGVAIQVFLRASEVSSFRYHIKFSQDTDIERAFNYLKLDAQNPIASTCKLANRLLVHSGMYSKNERYGRPLGGMVYDDEGYRGSMTMKKIVSSSEKYRAVSMGIPDSTVSFRKNKPELEIEVRYPSTREARPWPLPEALRELWMGATLCSMTPKDDDR